MARDGKTLEVVLPLAPSRGWRYPSGSQQRKLTLRKVKSLPKAAQLYTKAYPSLLS